MECDFKEKNPTAEKPAYGGECAIFRRIGCVGDSLSSGEIEIVNGEKRYYPDLYEYSWGQFLARVTGAVAYNFSRGGMTAKEMISGWGESNGCFDETKKCQAYVFALGVNDLFGLKQEVGTEKDGGTDRETFARYYADLLAKYRSVEPNAKFFLVTMPREESDGEDANLLKEKHAALLHAFARSLPHTYVIDLYRYAPVYDAAFKKRHFYNGHMNASGYRLTAEMLISYIHSIVCARPDDFTDVPLIGTEYYDLLP